MMDTVICPWCLKKEKTFTDSNDLALHFKKQHSKVRSLSHNVFSRANSFYFATHPEKYVVAIRPTAYSSVEAHEARKAIRKWCDSFTDSEARMNKWTAGWKVGDEFGEEPDVSISEPDWRDVTGNRGKWSKQSTGRTKRRREASVASHSSSSCDSLSSGRGGIQKVLDPSVKATLSESTVMPSGHESDSVSSSSSSEEELQDGDVLVSRARQILQRGAMPLCPPGRRVWTKPLKLPGSNDLEWPPKDFNKMSKDQLLLSLEYAANCIEHHNTGQFPTVPREVLIDKYNFLALPGTPLAVSLDAKKPTNKLRHYYYLTLLSIVKGECSGEIEQLVVENLEQFVRWSDTDIITNFLSENGINLRS